jgi:hypothetical protein
MCEHHGIHYRFIGGVRSHAWHGATLLGRAATHDAANSPNCSASQWLPVQQRATATAQQGIGPALSKTSHPPPELQPVPSDS